MTLRNAPKTMTPSVCHLAFAASLALILCGSSLAIAQTDPKASADEHFRKGVAAFRDRRFGDAAPEFEEAYRLSPAYVVLYNIGQVNAALGRSVEAVDAYERYLKQGAAEIQTDRAREVEVEISKQMDRIGTIAIRATAIGVEIRMDGRLVGKTPLRAPVRATVGKHIIEGTRQGYASQTHEIEVIGRSECIVDLKVERSAEDEDSEPKRGAADGARPQATVLPSAPAPAATPAPAPTITFVEVPRPEARAPAPVIAPPQQGTDWQRVIGYVVVAGGLATTTIGGLIAFDGWNRMNEADDRLRKGTTPAEYDALKVQYDIDYPAAKHRTNVGWATAGIGAASLLGGIIVVATAPNRSSSVALSLTPTVTAAANGLGVSGTF